MIKILKIIIACTLFTVGLLFISAESHAQEYSEWEYIVEDSGNITLTGYNGNKKDIVIPDLINGKNVENIGDEIFFGNETINSLVIPTGIKKIGNKAFFNSQINSITISDTVESIGYSCFEYCNNLTSIQVSASNTYYDSRDNCNAIIEKSSNKLIVGCKNTVIPKGVRIIGSRSFFECYNLQKIDIPDGVNTIEEYAFYECKKLKTVIIPDSITSIGENAFARDNGSRNKVSNIYYKGSLKKFKTLINSSHYYGFEDEWWVVNINKSKPSTSKSAKSGYIYYTNGYYKTSKDYKAKLVGAMNTRGVHIVSDFTADGM